MFNEGEFDVLTGKRERIYDDGVLKVDAIDGVDTIHLVFKSRGKEVAAFQPNIPALVETLQGWWSKADNNPRRVDE